MKMTVEQFRAWAANAKFEITDHIDGEGDREYEVDVEDDGTPVMGSKGYAVVWREAAATLPDGSAVSFAYQEGVEWQGDANVRVDDGYERYGLEGADEILIDGALTLIDEDGDDLYKRAQIDAAKDVLGEAHPFIDITDIDIESLIPSVSTIDIDIYEGADMDTITLENDNAAHVRFSGEMVAETSSSDNTASSYYSGSTGRWTTLVLYRTAAGKFVAQSIGHTRWQGEHNRYKVAVCETEAEVVAFFGHGWLAKDLYTAAGIEDVTEVE